MFQYRFKNLNLKHSNQDFLVSGNGKYVIEDYEEDGKEASFTEVEITDAIDKNGFVTSKEVLGHLAEEAHIVLNRDSHLCRVLGSKS